MFASTFSVPVKVKTIPMGGVYSTLSGRRRACFEGELWEVAESSEWSGDTGHRVRRYSSRRFCMNEKHLRTCRSVRCIGPRVIGEEGEVVMKLFKLRGYWG